MILTLPSMFENNKRTINLSKKKPLISILSDVLGQDLKYIIDSENRPYGYIQIFLNESQVTQLDDVYIENEDKIEILSAISGG